MAAIIIPLALLGGLAVTGRATRNRPTHPLYKLYKQTTTSGGGQPQVASLGAAIGSTPGSGTVGALVSGEPMASAPLFVGRRVRAGVTQGFMVGRRQRQREEARRGASRAAGSSTSVRV